VTVGEKIIVFVSIEATADGVSRVLFVLNPTKLTRVHPV